MVTEDARLKLAAWHMGFRYAIFSTLESVKFSVTKRLFFKSPLRAGMKLVITDLSISFEFRSV